jgi:hypothetical protein
MKDNLLKKITEERDHYKFNTNIHYSVNTCEYQQTDTTEVVNTFELNKNEEIQIFDNYINNRNNPNTPPMSRKSHSSSSGSIINYIKNIFKGN